MPFSKPFLRLAFLHTVVNTDEVAQFDVSLARSDTGTPSPPTPTQLANASDTYLASMTASGLVRAEYSRYIGIKAAQIQPDGTYAADPVILDLGAGVLGSAIGVPAQCTLAVSLQSGQTLGKGNYGRIYIPHVLPAFASGTPYLSSTRPAAVAAAFADFVDGLNTIFAESVGSPVVSIMSQAGPNPTAKPVTLVRCGRVLDTQRRRRNRLTENYASADVT